MAQSVHFIIKETVVPTTGWLDISDNGFWVADSGKGVWDGSAWDSEDQGGTHGMLLRATGTWNIDFRPTLMKVTVDVSIDTIVFESTPSEAGMGTATDPSLIVQVPTFGFMDYGADEDIGKMEITGALGLVPFTVTKIEAYVSE